MSSSPPPACSYPQPCSRQVLGHRKSDEASEAHKALDETFSKLSAKLDALFSFHFTPRRPKTEVTHHACLALLPSMQSHLSTSSMQVSIRSGVPAVAVEEAIPTAVAAGQTIAPQEVYAVKKSSKLANREELSQVSTLACYPPPSSPPSRPSSPPRPIYVPLHLFPLTPPSICFPLAPFPACKPQPPPLIRLHPALACRRSARRTARRRNESIPGEWLKGRSRLSFKPSCSRVELLPSGLTKKR